MSSKRERALVAFGSSGPALEPLAGDDPIASLLEMGSALAATVDLHQGVRDVLEVLNRRPAVVRSAVTLSVPGIAEVESTLGPGTGAPGADHRFVCATITLDGRTVGALAVDLASRGDAAQERLVRAAAELIGQAVRYRQLHARDEDPAPIPPDTSLADLVSHYEKGLIERALRATRGNRSRAARLLCTTERIIGYRVQQYGIDCSVYRG